MAKQIHYHKYERMKWPNGNPFYKCMEPNCSHYLPVLQLVIGKESLCWGPNCNKLVIITRDDVNRGLRRPMCEDCRRERLEMRKAMKEIS